MISRKTIVEHNESKRNCCFQKCGLREVWVQQACCGTLNACFSKLAEQREHEGTLGKCKKNEQAVASTKALTGSIVGSIKYGRLMKLMERTRHTKCDNYQETENGHGRTTMINMFRTTETDKL